MIRLLAVREGKLSPLALKRPPPVLHKSEPTEKMFETQEEIRVQMQHAFDKSGRVFGCIPETDYGVAPVGRKSKTTCLKVPSVEFAAAASQFFENRDVGSVAQWRDRTYLWDQVKDIPVDVRMATPFQHGNVCEDPQRCEALEEKGGNPSEIICPQCPAYTACRERGYLSQASTLQTTNVRIPKSSRLFSDPLFEKIVEQLFEADNGTQSLCIINILREDHLFLRCELPKTTLEEWVVQLARQCLRQLCDVLTECNRNQRQIPW